MIIGVFLTTILKKLEEFEWSGYVFASLLMFLKDQKEIDLFSSEFESLSDWISEKRSASVMIFTLKHKNAYLEKLRFENFNESELISFNKEFSEDESPELVIAEIDGIKAIYNSLKELKNENEVVVLTIG